MNRMKKIFSAFLLNLLMVTFVYADDTSSLFTYVNSLPQLKSKLAAASHEHKPVMIEFFATWCPYCKQVDRDVLTDSKIRETMKHFMTLRVDVSEQSYENSQMMDEYNVMGVPTMVFYDKDGNIYKTDVLEEGIHRDNLQGLLNKLS